MNRSGELARALLRKARDDQFVLTQLAGNPDSPLWTLGFHAQQAVEKAIKAVLSARCVDFPYTHDLQRLMELLVDSGQAVPPDAQQLPALTPFGVTLRYDEEPQAAGQETLDPEWAVRCVGRTIDWAEAILGG